ncbi:MAG: hypothetical protein E7043_09010 [Lentisphaerae bacterium]|nr:hypothetical protein [Lentisphaerota bacterium]
MITVGAAENIIEVPLFSELGGYGPFLGRRNIGIRDPLFCRVLTVNDGQRRNVIIVTDTIASDEVNCRILRMELASEFALYPESIMFVATHTHSAPCIASCDVGYGEPDVEFLNNWRQTIRRTLADAIAGEEVVRAFAGKAPVRNIIGQRRTSGSDKTTDTDIRFVKFIRPDGSVKALLHNHAMHGVVFGETRLVSADWMGNANTLIKERKLAEIPIFLYGTAGDINVIWQDENGKDIPIEVWATASEKSMEQNLQRIGKSYVDDLACGLENGQEISLAPVKAVLRTFEFPTEAVDAVVYREIAEKLLKKLPSPFETLLRYTHDRMVEMAVLAEKGKDFRVLRDLQVLKMGDLAISAVPGEPFLALGNALCAGAKSLFPMAVSVANGDAGYYPTAEMFEEYPDIFCCDDFGAFGFYEVWFGAGLHRPKFKPGIVNFIVEKLLEMENTL